MGGLVLTLAGALGRVVWSLPRDGSGLAEPALAQLPNSGVTNPVTAAVLNYRGYDTLLEIAVPLMILLAATCFGLAPLRPAERSKAARSWPPRLFYCDLAESPGRAG